MILLGVFNFAAALQGIFLAYLLINKKGDQLEYRYLALLVLIVSLSILGPVLGITGYYRQLPYLIRVSEPLALLFGPLLYIYIFVLSEGKPPRYFYLHFLPFVIYTAFLFPFYMLPPAEKIALIEAQVNKKVSNMWGQVIRLFHVSLYIFFAYRQIHSLQQKLKQSFSDLNKFKLHQSIHILKFYAIIIAICFVICIVSLVHPMDFVVVNNIAGLSVGLLIYSLAYVNWNHPGISPAVLPKAEAVPNRQEPTERKRLNYYLSEEQFRKYADKLGAILLEQQVYLNPELSLNHLSENLGIPAYQVSEIINRHYEVSFFDLINQFRVNEVKKRLADPAYNHFSVLAISMDCGFNSKSSFNNAFKKITGTTPSEYRKLKS
ncbi:AraC family transcriptional regulator [Niastella caeni]|uniref:AraC family transcriptional regulator n=1 Tax=Niastella caeni TaxID=2569763 RepID=A0A4S8HWY0_9BACT|nr:helix-turn-helix domain-containing protein [Niastella caeni]THU40140.1 AraC family transcriptional regulator [Niastella caeni]